MDEREELGFRALRLIEREPVDAELFARPDDAVARHVVLPAPHLGQPLEMLHLLLALRQPALGRLPRGALALEGGSRGGQQRTVGGAGALAGALAQVG